MAHSPETSVVSHGHSRQPFPQKQHSRDIERQALELLHAHRQHSGYVPWSHGDNEQLRALDHERKQKQQAEIDLQVGLVAYQCRATAQPPSWKALIDALPNLTASQRDVSLPSRLEIRIDPELGRLAVGLDRVREYQVWAVARHFFGQPGWTRRDLLYEALNKARVIHSRRHCNRLLKQGAGLFWNLTGDRVYLRGAVKVAARMTALAKTQHPSLVATNIPGVRDVYIRAGGDLGAFKAQIYAGWLAHREGPKIARDTLCRLFGVSRETLRNWEQRLGADLEIITNYGQTAVNPRDDDRVTDFLPEHCYNYVTRRGQIRIRWRQPNTYRPKTIRQHPYKGQSRKARTAAAKVAWLQPVEIWARKPEKIPFDRTHREPRRYFATAKALRRFLDRLERRGKGAAPPKTPRYVYRGEDRYRHGIWELSPDGEVQTTAVERMSIRAEYGWWAGFAARTRLARAG